MKNRKFSMLLIIIVIISLFLAACSNSTNNNTANNNNSNQNQDDVIDLNGATIKIAGYWELDPAKAASPTEVTEKKAAKILEIEEKFNVNIEFVTVPYTEMLGKLTATALSGDPVGDLVRVDAKWLPSLVAGGYVRDLSEITDLSDPVFTEAVKINGTYNNVQYGFLEQVVDGAGLFYNKAIIKREGLENPEELIKNGEWTWEKMLELSKAATKDLNGDGVMDQFGISSFQPTLATFLILSNGTTIFDDSTGKVNLGHENATEALQFLSDLYNKDKVVLPPEGDSYQQARTEFNAGKVLFTVGSTWEGNTRLQPDQMADDWGYILFPKGPKASGYSVPQIDTNMYFVTSGSKYPSEVVEIWKESVLWDMLEQDFDDFMDWAFRHDTDKASAKSMPPLIVRDYFNGFAELNTLFNDAVGKITRGESTPATAVESILAPAQASIDAVLKQ